MTGSSSQPSGPAAATTSALQRATPPAPPRTVRRGYLVAPVIDGKQNGGVLTGEEVERFIIDGFVYLPEAFPRPLADECRSFLWRETGADRDDPATWTKPVIRLPGYGGELFNAAANTPVLHEAFDQLVGD